MSRIENRTIPMASASSNLSCSRPLLSKQLLMKEFEILMWACLNSKDDISQIINAKDSMSANARNIINRVLMTAFFVKKTLSDENTVNIITAFFSQNFPQFIGKHTEWLLLHEPDLTLINSLLLNNKLKEFKTLYEQMNDRPDEVKEEENDFNKLVEQLGEEHTRIDQHNKQRIQLENQRKEKKRLYDTISCHQTPNKRFKNDEQQENQKGDSPNKDISTSFTGINLFNSKIYGSQIANQFAKNQFQKSREQHQTGQCGEVQDFLRINSGVYDMKELLNYITTGPYNKKEEELHQQQQQQNASYDQIEQQNNNYSVFGANDLPSFNNRYEQDSTQLLSSNLDKSLTGSFSTTFRIPSRNNNALVSQFKK